jgi:hypothetical protein
MMISKISVIIQKLCIIVSGIGCLVSIALLPASSPWRIGFLIALVLSSIWHILNTKCPHCGRFGGLKPKPFAQDAGKCIHCGEQVEYR